jgi:hypothetical protein
MYMYIHMYVSAGGGEAKIEMMDEAAAEQVCV